MGSIIFYVDIKNLEILQLHSIYLATHVTTPYLCSVSYHRELNNCSARCFRLARKASNPRIISF